MNDIRITRFRENQILSLHQNYNRERGNLAYKNGLQSNYLLSLVTLLILLMQYATKESTIDLLLKGTAWRKKKKKKPDIFEPGNQNEGAGKDYCQAK